MPLMNAKIINLYNVFLASVLLIIHRNDFFGDQEFYSGLVDAGVHGEALLFIDLKLLRGFVNSVELHLDGIQPNSDLINELVTLQFTFNDQVKVVFKNPFS